MHGLLASIITPLALVGVVSSGYLGDQYGKYGWGLRPKDPCSPQEVLDLARRASTATPEEYARIREEIREALRSAAINCNPPPRPCCIPPKPEIAESTRVYREVRARMDGSDVLIRVAELAPDGTEVGRGREFGRIAVSEQSDAWWVQVDRDEAHRAGYHADSTYGGKYGRYTKWTQVERESDVRGTPGLVVADYVTGTVRVVLSGGPPEGVQADIPAHYFLPDSSSQEFASSSIFNNVLAKLVAEDPRLAIPKIAGGHRLLVDGVMGIAAVVRLHGSLRLIFGKADGKSDTYDFWDLLGPTSIRPDWQDYLTALGNSSELPPELGATLHAWMKGRVEGRLRAIASTDRDRPFTSPIGSIRDRIAGTSVLAAPPSAAAGGAVLIGKSGEWAQRVEATNLDDVDPVTVAMIFQDSLPTAMEAPLAVLALRDSMASIVAINASESLLVVRSHSGLWSWRVDQGVPVEAPLVAPGSVLALTGAPASEFVDQIPDFAPSESPLLEWAKRSKPPTLLDYFPNSWSVLYSESGAVRPDGTIDRTRLDALRGGLGTTSIAIQVVEPNGSPLASAKDRYTHWRDHLSELIDSSQGALGLLMGPRRAAFIRDHNARPVVEAWTLNPGPIRMRKELVPVVVLHGRVENVLYKKFGRDRTPPSASAVLQALVSQYPEGNDWRSDVAGLLDKDR